MKFWRDVIDWLGGYPFEVADLHEVVRYVEAKGFQLQNMNPVGWRNGCNEWVFRRKQ
jgi:2-polyprenyl-6-hydroxyphenyl methylase/3-demethylubiquinone-9 3-methyltransferase